MSVISAASVPLPETELMKISDLENISVQEAVIPNLNSDLHQNDMTSINASH